MSQNRSLSADLVDVQRRVWRKLSDPRPGPTRLFEIFRLTGVTERQLAAFVGRHYRTVCDWCTGRNPPPVDCEGKLLALLAWVLALVADGLAAAGLPVTHPRHARLLALVNEGDALIRGALLDGTLGPIVQGEWKTIAAALATTREGQTFVRQATERIERLCEGRGH